MTIINDDLKESAAANTLLAPNPEMVSVLTANVLFGVTSVATSMAIGYPVGYNSTLGQYGPYTAPSAATLTVDIDGSTGGTWGVTVGGIVLANTTFADDVTAALVIQTLRGIGYEVSCTLAAGVYTITFDDPVEIAVAVVVSGDVTQLTGGTTPTAVAVAGVSTFGTDVVKGFVYPATVLTSTTLQTQGVIMVKGKIVKSLATSLVDSGDVTALEASMRNGLLDAGLDVQDLTGRY